MSKEDLKIKIGNYQIISNDDGIRRKDFVYILGGAFEITSGGKLTNNTDSDKDFVLIEDGTFKINATLDGVSAETKVLIKTGTFDITTGGGSTNASTKEDWGMWGRRPYATSSSTSTNESSAKGIKSKDNLVIEDGIFNFNPSDDAIHSNNYVGIIDGDINISSEDDGINVAGGMDSSASARKGANTYNSSSNNILTINNGTIHIDAVGDGIDINGSGYIYGGTTTVEGPTDSGNGTLDYDKELKVDGGTLIGSGSSGMAQAISNNSNQYNIMINFTQNITSNDTIKIIDSNNNEILNYTASKTYSSLIFSSNKLNKNSTYTIKINDEEYQSFTITDITTTIGRSIGMGGMTPDGGTKPTGRR